LIRGGLERGAEDPFEGFVGITENDAQLLGVVIGPLDPIHGGSNGLCVFFALILRRKGDQRSRGGNEEGKDRSTHNNKAVTAHSVELKVLNLFSPEELLDLWEGERSDEATHKQRSGSLDIPWRFSILVSS